MKKRIVLLTTLAAMLAAAMALSGLAQAAPISDKADAQCLKLAIKTLGPSFNPSNYTFIGGTEGDDDFSAQGTAGQRDVFCGFSGTDQIETLEAGDIFLGGAVFSFVNTNNGTFYGGEGTDAVAKNTGTFYGGASRDEVLQNQGTFYGGAGDDLVHDNQGTFYGGAGDDVVSINSPSSTFDGGEGDDFVERNFGGCLINVEFGDVLGSIC
jgi:cytochrome c551/c552